MTFSLAVKPPGNIEQQTMPDLLQTLAAYVPPSLSRASLKNVEPAPPRAAQVERFAAAVLFADISGFTPLTEALARLGSEGPEELTRLLSRHGDESIHSVISNAA